MNVKVTFNSNSYIKILIVTVRGGGLALALKLTNTNSTSATPRERKWSRSVGTKKMRNVHLHRINVLVFCQNIPLFIL